MFESAAARTDRRTDHQSGEAHFSIHSPQREGLAYLEMAARKGGQQAAGRPHPAVLGAEPSWSVPWARWAPTEPTVRRSGHSPAMSTGLDIATYRWSEPRRGGRPTQAIKVWDCGTRELVTELDAADLARDRGARRVFGRGSGCAWSAGTPMARWPSGTQRTEATRPGTRRAAPAASSGSTTRGSSRTGPFGLVVWDPATATVLADIPCHAETSLEAAGRVDSTDYAIILDRRERHVELWDLDRREPAGAPLVLTERTSVWACALGWAGTVPAAYIGLAGRDASASSSSVYGIRDWPRVIQAISGSVPLSAAMTGEGGMPLLSPRPRGRHDPALRLDR